MVKIKHFLRELRTDTDTDALWFTEKGSILTGGCNVGLWVHPVKLDHEVAVLLVGVGRLRWVDSSEKLRKGLSLDISDRVHIEPVCRLGGQSERLRVHRCIIGTVKVGPVVQSVLIVVFCRVFNLRNLLVQLLSERLFLECLFSISLVKLYKHQMHSFIDTH